MKNCNILIFWVVILLFVACLKADYPEYAFSEYVYYKGTKYDLKNGADFSDIYLGNNSFSRRLGILRDINFEKTRLNNCSFVETGFVNCSFRGAKMVNVDASDTGFEDCDFTDTDISGTTFCSVLPENLVQTKNYKEKNLSSITILHPFSWNDQVTKELEIDFSEFDLQNAHLMLDMRGINFDNAHIRNASFLGYNPYDLPDKMLPCFTLHQLYQTKDYRQGTVIGVKFYGVDLSDVSFNAMNLTDCLFLRYKKPSYIEHQLPCSLKNANFTDAVISGCDFSDVENLTVDQIKSTWNYKVGRMEGIKLPPDIAEALEKEKNGRKDGVTLQSHWGSGVTFSNVSIASL